MRRTPRAVWAPLSLAALLTVAAFGCGSASTSPNGAAERGGSTGAGGKTDRGGSAGTTLSRGGTGGVADAGGTGIGGANGGGHVGIDGGAAVGGGNAGGGTGAAGTIGGMAGADGGDCPSPQTTGVRWVDHAHGRDDEDHGTATGPCAYKTFTYALKKGPGLIVLSARDVYQGGVAGEELPFLMQKEQALMCNGATLANAADQGTFDGILQLAGTSNQVVGCNFDGGKWGGYCALVNAAASSSATPHVVSGSTFTGCDNVSLAVSAGSNHVRIDQNTFTLDFGGIEILGDASDVTITGNTFTGTTDDVICDDRAPGVTGSGNVRGGGSITCATCGACPF